MNTKSFKILTVFSALMFFVGFVSAEVSNLRVENDPVNNAGEVFALGNISESGAESVVFKVSQGEVSFEVTGLDLASENNNNETPEGFNFTVDLDGRTNFGQDGDVNLSADQTNKDSFQTLEDSVNFTLDDNPHQKDGTPSIEKLSGGRLNVSFNDDNSSEYAEVVSYILERKEADGSFSQIEEIQDDNTSYHYVDTEPANGTEYSYGVKAVDSAGNIGDLSGVSSSFADSKGPSISGKFPGGDTSNITTDVKFNLSDANGVDESSLGLNVTNSGQEKLSQVGTESGHIEFIDSEQVVIDVNGSDSSFDYEPGTVEIDYSVRDDLGNWRNETWDFIVDTSAPNNFVIEEPGDGAEVRSQSTIEGTVNDDNDIQKVELRIENGTDDFYWKDKGDEFDTSESWFEVESQNGDWSYNSSGIEKDGIYFVKVKATDEAGNTAEMSGTSNYTIDNVAPFLKRAEINDTDFDGEMDEINVTFSEPIDEPSSDVVHNSFELSNGSITPGTGIDTGVPDDQYINLEVEGLDTGQTPELTMLTGDQSTEIKDAAGNNLTTDNTTKTVDVASPVLEYATVDSVLSNYSSTVLELGFSETVEGSGDTDVVFNGTSLDFVGSDSERIRGADIGDVVDTSLHLNVTGFNSVDDGSGNDAVLYEGENVTVSTFRRELVEGWNFVSFPISSNSAPSVTDFYPDEVDEVWTYRNGNWSLYNEDNDGSDLDYVYAGEGYLFDVKKDFVLEPKVENVLDIQSPTKTPPTRSVSEGWNLVGAFQEYNQYANESGAFQSLGNAFGTVKGQRVPGDLKLIRNPSMVQPGYAYWLSPNGDLSGGSVTYSER